MTGMPFDLRPVSSVMGGEIAGIDLTRPTAPATASAILDAFARHRLLVVRDQKLAPEDLHRFALLFGEIEGHAIRQADGARLGGVHTITNLDASGRPVERPLINTNYFWHSDKSFLAVPSLATMLHAMEIPPSGGDTEFADMTAAYEALPADTKAAIAGLRVVQSLDYMRLSTGNAPPSDDERQAAPPVDHPLVRTHVVTGAKSLYLGMYSAHVLGMDEADGRALLDRLSAHATQRRFVYAHEWRPGDLVLWDNRCLMHRAVANFEMGKHRRILMRVVVRGERPV